MIINGNGNPGRIVRGPTPAEAAFDVSSTPRVETSYATTKDTTFRTQKTEHDVSASVPVQSFAASNAGVATVSPQGAVSRVSNGTVGIIVRTRLAAKRVDVEVSQGAPAVHGYVPGSLAEHLASQVDSRLALRAGSQIHNAPILDANTASGNITGYGYDATCWAADLDLTGVSVSNPKCCMLTPEHYITAEHYQAYRYLRFMAADGTIVIRGNSSGGLARVNIGPANATDAYNTDLTIGRLETPLPSQFKVYKVLPKNWETYIPGLANRIPVLRTPWSRNAAVIDTQSFGPSTTYSLRVPADATRLTRYYAAVNGDSSSQVFVVANGEPVLVGTTTGGGAGSGPWMKPSTLDLIQAAIDSLGNPNGYQLQQADFSAWPSF